MQKMRKIIQIHKKNNSGKVSKRKVILSEETTDQKTKMSFTMTMEKETFHICFNLLIRKEKIEQNSASLEQNKILRAVN